MIKSMTGFGKSESIYLNKRILVEIKSLNSKFFDMNARIPNGFKDKELEIRNILSGRLHRGKIDFLITVEESGESGGYTINKSLAKKYFNELKELSVELEIDASDFMSVLIRMPEIMVAQRNEMSAEEWNSLKQAIEKAADELDEFRTEEGNSLKIELESRTAKIENYLEEVDPFEEGRIETLKERIKKDVYQVASKDEVDVNRFEQELVYYLEKLDITEEKIRLSKHCKYFLETLNEPGSQGKKLGFISQEMGREINTLGSKANNVNIQKLVVQMKDELEKIKEQLFNIL